MDDLKTVIEQPLYKHHIWYKKENDRLKLLTEYANRLGESEEIERLNDEKYRLIFTHHQTLVRLANKAHYYGSKNSDPHIKGYFNELEQRLIKNSNEVANTLNGLTNVAIICRSLEY